MGIYVIAESVVSINGTDLSDHVTSVEVMMSAEDVDATTMVASGTALGTVRRQGKRDDAFNISFLSDFAASEVNATLYPLMNSGSVFPVSVRHAGTSVTSTTPSFSGSCILTEYSPISGAVGDLSSTDVTFPVSGIITMATA